MKAVLDTNVLVSALLSPLGPPAAIWQAWRDGRFQLLTSPALLDELGRVLTRPRISRRLGWTSEEQQLFLELLAEQVTLFVPGIALAVIANDPSDDRVLEAAVAGEADYIVSGDRHLLDLGLYDTIPIVTPARFIAALSLAGR